ncbi:hypothetical protein CSKR_111897 [Clonorchis sinensis]|uniref:Uncharacterized protein n=1 Tax=Clonorchis sinensis TaxID=79923 RepID=A0A419Q9R0_CLOSI|nr:hypothetical protein CSKR_111897 [Clonorchis sinensis]
MRSDFKLEYQANSTAIFARWGFYQGAQCSRQILFGSIRYIYKDTVLCMKTNGKTCEKMVLFYKKVKTRVCAAITDVILPTLKLMTESTASGRHIQL